MRNDLSSFLICLMELEKIDEKLSSLYLQSNNLYNHKIGVYKIFRKLLNNCRFIYETAEISSQQIVMSLARMTIDHYSVLYLLSCYSSRKEQKLRYYLYLLDSFNNRISTITNFSTNFNNMNPDVLEENKRSNLHDKSVIDKIFQLIKEEGLGLNIADSIIENNNWKFQSDHPAQNKKTYTWQELYNIARIPPHFSKAIQNHFSSFTHGLGMTILYSEDNPKSTLYVYEFIALLQTLIGKMMILNYSKELKDIEFRRDFLDLGEERWENWDKY